MKNTKIQTVPIKINSLSVASNEMGQIIFLITANQTLCKSDMPDKTINFELTINDAFYLNKQLNETVKLFQKIKDNN